VTIGWVLLWLLVGLAGLLLLALLLLLFLPLDLRLRLHSDLAAADWEAEPEGSARWTVHFRWGWWLLVGEWCGENLEPRPPSLRLLGFRLRTDARRKSAEPAAGRKRFRVRRLDTELIRAVWAEAGRFLRRLWGDFGPQAKGRLTYGFPDPALTGWCEAARWATRVRIPFPLEPVFDHPCLVGWAEATGRIYGFEIAREALRALRNKVIRRRIAESIRFRPFRFLILRGG
jgi:hypothetical protein